MNQTGFLFAAPQDEVYRQVAAVGRVTQVRKGERQELQLVEQFTKPDFSAAFSELENLG